MPPRFLFLLVVLTPLVSSAQEPHIIPRLRGPVEIDGFVDEQAWANVSRVPLTMMSPTFRGEPSVTSEARIAYDDDYLYLAGRLYDDPAYILNTSYKRDLMQPNADYFGVFIDSYNDNENGLAFYTTPTGIRLDFSMLDDAEGDEPYNASWDTFWDAAVSQDSSGWYAEIRIPFSSLKFEDDDGRTEMGIIVMRWAGKRNEVYTFPAINPTYGFWSWAKPSLAETVTFEGIFSSRPLYVTPYLLGGIDQRFELDAPATAYQRVDDPTYEAGLDLKYALTNNLTMDVTVNTDFAQVEADDQQVNLTRFSLFFPEKRRFFLERAGIFDFRLGGPNQLFYSRRIGLHEGEQIRILGGVKIAGRLEGWDVGFLDMHTASGAGLPSQNHGVVRLRKQTFNAYSYSGGIVTSRLAADGTYNVAYGIDNTVRVAGDDYVVLRWAQTYDDDLSNRPVDVNAMRINAAWERRTFSGFGYGIEFARTGAVYRPDLGFQARENYTLASGRIGWGWLPGSASRLQSHRVGLENAIFWRNEDGAVESVEVGPSWEATWKSGWAFDAAWTTAYEDLIVGFAVDQAEIPAGRYWFHGVEANLEAPGTRKLWGQAAVTVGSFFGGMRMSTVLAPIWNMNRVFEFQAEYELNRLRFDDPIEDVTAHIGRLRGQATFNTEWALSAFVQYSSAIDAVITNLRLRFNPREGNDLYVVYNEVINTERDEARPRLPFTSGRTVVAKYTYTFQW